MLTMLCRASRDPFSMLIYPHCQMRSKQQIAIQSLETGGTAFWPGHSRQRRYVGVENAFAACYGILRCMHDAYKQLVHCSKLSMAFMQSPLHGRCSSRLFTMHSSFLGPLFWRRSQPFWMILYMVYRWAFSCLHSMSLSVVQARAFCCIRVSSL